MGTELTSFISHNHWVAEVVITPDGKKAVSAGCDKNIKLWDLEIEKKMTAPSDDNHWVEAIAITPDGKKAISGSRDKNLKLWDLKTGKETTTLSGHNNSVTAVTITSDGKKAISGSRDKTLKVWNLETEMEITTLTGHEDQVTAVAITPDGKKAVSACTDKTLKVWNLETGKEIATLGCHQKWVNAVAVTSDGKKALSGSWDNTLKLWDLETRKEITTLAGHSGPVNAVTITPDGKKAVSGSSDNTLKLWDLETRKEITTLAGHSGPVNAVTVTRDGKKAVSVSGDYTLKLWDLEAGKEITTFIGESWISCCAVSPDGFTIVAGEQLGRVHFLQLEGGLKNESISHNIISIPRYPPEFQQILTVKNDNFVGREFVFTAINNFLHQYDRGYFTIIGEPGIGKSAILAHYVSQNVGLVYYNVEINGKNCTDEFLNNICTQLIEISQNQGAKNIAASLTDSTMKNSSFLLLLLQQISDQLHPEQRLIITVDGCDRIDIKNQPRGANIFYLPRYLPEKVYFILTRRPFLADKSGLLIETPAQSLDLANYPEQNWAEIQEYIKKYLDELSHSEVSGNEEANLRNVSLNTRQQGFDNETNFMYVKEILAAINDDIYPQNLQLYYQNHLEKMKLATSSQQDIALQVLNILVQEQSISIETIAERLDADEYEIKVILGKWREFLRLESIAAEIHYSIYHANFRDWLRQQILSS